MKKHILALVLGLLLSTACGSAEQMRASLTGRPAEFEMGNGVRCYYSQSGSLSCVFVGR